MSLFSRSIIITSILASIFSLSVCSAQSIQGAVVNANTEKPLLQANIVQLNTQNGTSTDKKGNFSLRLIENQSKKIRVSYVGYKSQILKVPNIEKFYTIKLEPRVLQTNEVFVEALRVDKSVPVASETISQAQVAATNVGQDLPYLLESTLSAVVTSDAGGGIGYTGIRIRGVDPARINVTINGIPENDAESHGLFWVDMPDLASSVQDIQVQRGVGTSTNGAAAFGATINVQTSEMKAHSFGEVNMGGGSFNTRRVNVKLGSGLMDNGWQFQGRLSKINSDGYIDRAFSDLKSFYLSAAHHGDHGLLRADIFSGKEKTYQAWDGVPEDKLDSDRTYNGLGTEKPGKPYKNQTDNYQQDHYQLHYSYDFTNSWNANISLHYTYGRGYYEEYKADQQLSDYGMSAISLPDTTITRSNLVRQLWLDNYFYGTVFSSSYQHNSWKLIVGGGYNEYRGSHFGELVQTAFGGTVEPGNHYYDNDAFKSDGNLYAKLNYSFTNTLTGYLDLQVRHIKYKFLGKDLQPAPGGGQDTVDVTQTDQLTFFNPKIGVVYHLDNNQRMYASLSVGNKEATRDEYVNSTPETRPKHETLYDWEGGYKISRNGYMAGANVYYMDYKNQLIPTGEINNVGSVVRQNVPDSYRAGVELQAGMRIIPTLQWSVNATFSRNKIDQYTQYYDNYDTGKQAFQVYNDTNISFAPSFIGNSILNFSKKAFTAELTTKYVSRQYLDNTEATSRSIDPYFVNDLRLSYNFGGLALVKNIKATLQLNNLLDEKYETNGYTYGYISGGEQQHFNYYYPQAGRNYLARLSIDF